MERPHDVRGAGTPWGGSVMEGNEEGENRKQVTLNETREAFWVVRAVKDMDCVLRCLGNL